MPTKGSNTMRIPAAILTLTLLLGGAAMADPGDEATFASAKELAAQRGVPVLLDFFTET